MSLAPANLSSHSNELVERADFFRVDATRKLDPSRRTTLGQFLTPAPLARLMASMFKKEREHINLLDAGAGVGVLTAAFMEEMGRWENKPRSVSVTAYEIDPLFTQYLTETLALCRVECESAGIKFDAEIVCEDFIESAVSQLNATLFTPTASKFNCTILNPPLRSLKYPSRSELEAFGSDISDEFPTQNELDYLVEKELLKMGADEEGVDPNTSEEKDR